MLLWLKTYWSPGIALTANTAGKALKSHFSEFFPLYLIPSFFLFFPVGLKKDKNRSLAETEFITVEYITKSELFLPA